MVGELRHLERHFGRTCESGLGSRRLLFAERRQSRSRRRYRGTVHIRSDRSHLSSGRLLGSRAVLYPDAYATCRVWRDCGWAHLAAMAANITLASEEATESPDG